MANVIKHKRGTGSDPSAGNLVIGELAIRTDTGKLFTKMDSGAIAEIAGGGSDIAINTLSSSSGTGGGSATFNGSAYRFTLSAPPNVSAAQLLVSINGVIQKPVTGTGQPSEGFAVDGTDIILGDAPATGSDFFILTFKSLGVSEPADNSVTSAKIVDGAIVNADINASAAIAGTKISPDFGSQNIVTTGTLAGSDSLTFSGTTEEIKLSTSDASDNGYLNLSGGGACSQNRAAQVVMYGNEYSGQEGKLLLMAGNSGNANGVAGFYTGGSQRMTIDSSGRVGIGTTTGAVGGAPSSQTGQFNVVSSAASGQWAMQARADNAAGNGLFLRAGNSSSYYTAYLTGYDENNVHMVVRGDGNVGIGTTSPDRKLDVSGTGNVYGKFQSTNATGAGIEVKDTSEDWLIQADGGSVDGLAFYDLGRSAYRMVINDSGNVGIGTTSPNSLLNIHGVFETNAYDSTSGNGGRTSTGLLIGDAYSAGKTSSDDRNSIIWNERGLDIDFATADTVRMKIDSSGDVLIGKTSDNFDTAGTHIDGGQIFNLVKSGTGDFIKLNRSTNVGTFIEFRRGSGSTVGSISSNNTTTSYNTSSDYRLKENAVAISDGITRLKTLKPYRFNFKADADTTVDGFLAHEVTAVPEAITGTKDEVDSDNKPVYQGIDQSKLVPLLTAALQEAIGRIEALEAK